MNHIEESSYIPSQLGQPQQLNDKAPEYSHHTLGFHLNGDGCSEEQKQVMKEKVILYGEAITLNTLWRGEISLAYNVFYMKSISYGTPGTPLSFKECNNVQKHVFNYILPKMGINLKAARSVVFGTAQYGGLGLDHLETVQNYGQLIPNQQS
jgi:hypothetical protein